MFKECKRDANNKAIITPEDRARVRAKMQQKNPRGVNDVETEGDEEFDRIDTDSLEMGGLGMFLPLDVRPTDGVDVYEAQQPPKPPGLTSGAKHFLPGNDGEDDESEDDEIDEVAEEKTQEKVIEKDPLQEDCPWERGRKEMEGKGKEEDEITKSVRLFQEKLNVKVPETPKVVVESDDDEELSPFKLFNSMYRRSVASPVIQTTDGSTEKMPTSADDERQGSQHQEAEEEQPPHSKPGAATRRKAT